MGYQSNTTYDAAGRVTTKTDANGGITAFTYDSKGNLTALTDQNGSATTFEYSSAGRKTKETRPMGQTTEYTYYANGMTKTVKDAKGQVSTYIYNKDNRLTEIDYADSKKDAFTYDAKGNMTTYSSEDVSGTLIYDNRNRKTSETVNFGAFSKTYSYDYDNAGNKASYTSPENTTYAYTYNDNRRPTTITFNGQTISLDYQWDRVTKTTLPSGVETEYTYNNNLWLSGITARKGSTNISSSQYGFDNVGNITGKGTEQGANSYSYDNIYQLTNATSPVLPTEAFSYDKVGNRVTATGQKPINYTHDANNEMTAYDGATLTYDANGNLTQQIQGTQSTVFNYNARNRLEQVTLPDGRTATYTYDPFGRRIKKQVGTEVTYFAYADEGLIGEYDTSGNLKKAYGWMPNSTWGTNPVFMLENNSHYYYHNDHLGTPQKMTDSNGNVVWSATYTAFGEAIVDSSSTVTNNLRYPGQYFDEETGLHYNWNRYYNPKTGRYISKDPIGFAGGDENLYRYVVNNPYTLYDPLGLVDYDVDSQGFHVRLDTKDGTTVKVIFNDEGSYTVEPKKGHPMSNKELEKATNKFNELMKNVDEQKKMRDAVARQFDKYKNKEFIKDIGRNLRRACQKIKIDIPTGLGTMSLFMDLIEMYDVFNRAEATGKSPSQIFLEDRGFVFTTPEA